MFTELIADLSGRQDRDIALHELGKAMSPVMQLVIDRFDVAHNGAYAVWFGRQLRVENVREVRGARPWNVWPRPRTQ